MQSFTIKDLENLSGIKAHTLRVWEQRYNFLKPSRTSTKIRYYNNEELKKILNVALLNKFGYKVSLIGRMNDSEINEKIVSLIQPLAQQERIVNNLIHNMIDMNLEAMEETLDDYIMARGIEKTITQVIFSYLQRIGILWQTNHINPAQEHLVTNIIRQKLIAGLEAVHPVQKKNVSILMFLPEGEHHELGLLFMYYLLKSRGANVIYLGANIPVKDVLYVVNIKKPDFLYTHITSAGPKFNFEKFLLSIKRHMGTTPIIVSGNLTTTYEKKIKPPLFFKNSFQEAMEFVSGL